MKRPQLKLPAQVKLPPMKLPPFKRPTLRDVRLGRLQISQLPVALVLSVLVIVALVASFTGATAKPARPLAVVTAPVTSESLICPSIAGNPAGTTAHAVVADLSGALTPPSTSTGKVTATVLAGAKRTTTTLATTPAAVIASTPKVDKTVAINAVGSVAATVAADQVTVTGTGRSRALTDSRCESPQTDWWFAGASGQVGFSDTLYLSNSAPTIAEVTIALWGPKGQIVNPGLESIKIPPLSVIHPTLAQLAPDFGPLTVHVHATSGAVAAALLDRRTSALNSNGGDFLPPTQPPSRAAVVAGFAHSQGEQTLVLGNPGSVDATVSVKIVAESGSFVPSGIGQVVVPAGRTVNVSLDRALNGSTGAVELRSDQPIVAQGLSVLSAKPQRPDLMWLAATSRLTGPAAVADGREPDGGHTLLLLTAPGAAGAVKVATPGGPSTTISIPAGHSVSVDITTTVKAGGGQWGFVATPVGSAPIYGVRVLSFTGAHGALIAGEPLIALPTPIVLPPVRADPRVAAQ
jgi:hypothetical protein